jgi:periplasmic copper chaperone A
MMIRRLEWGILGVAAAASLSACKPPATSGTLEPNGAWARATAPGQEVGAVYLTIRNDGAKDDRLLGGSTPAAQSVEIHSMRMDSTIMRMRRQDGLDIPAGGSAELGPGGTHLMLVGLKAPLVAGETIPLGLDFAKAGRKEIRVGVRPIGSSGPRDGGDE